MGKTPALEFVDPGTCGPANVPVSSIPRGNSYLRGDHEMLCAEAEGSRLISPECESKHRGQCDSSREDQSCESQGHTCCPCVPMYRSMYSYCPVTRSL